MASRKKNSPQTVEKQIISITNAAKAQLYEIKNKATPTEKHPQPSYLLFDILNGGCAGMRYNLKWTEQINPLDEKCQFDDLEIYISRKAILFLIGTEIDYQVNPMSSGFVFNNPNSTGECGCGESVALQSVAAETLKKYNLTEDNPSNNHK